MRNRIVSAIKPLSTITPSSYYLGHWRCTQAVGSGAVVDSSGNGRTLALGSQLVDDGSGIWGANPGFLSMPGKQDAGEDGTELSVATAAAVPARDWSEYALLVGFFYEVGAAESTATENIMGTGGQSAAPGWAIESRANGQLAFRAHSGASSYIGAQTTSDIDDGAVHHVACLFDGTTGLLSFFIDGVVDDNINAVDASAAVAILQATTEGPFVFGCSGDGAGFVSTPCRLRDVHVLAIPGGAPPDIGRVLSHLRGRMFAALPDSVLV